MSQEQALAFVERIKSTPDLQHEITSLNGDIEGIVALGQRKGFTFSEADVAAAYQSKRAEAGQPLSDAELEQVAGGIFIMKPMDPAGSTQSAIPGWPCL